MKHIFSLIFLIFSFVANAQTIESFVPAKPAYARLYSDENAYAYYHTAWRKVEDKLINHYKKTGNQLVVAVIPTTNGYPIDELATATFRKWGIGDKETNTGLLVLIARKEKQIKIETGYGIEAQVTDYEAGKIIDGIVNPGLDSFNFLLIPMHPTQGYLPTVNKLVDTLILLTPEINTTSINNTARQRVNKNFTRPSIVIAVIVLAVFLYSRYKKIRYEKT